MKITNLIVALLAAGTLAVFGQDISGVVCLPSGW